MLAMLQGGCATRSVPVTPSPCQVEVWPDIPDLDDVKECEPPNDGDVCVPILAAKDLGLYIRRVERIHATLAHCGQVKEVK